MKNSLMVSALFISITSYAQKNGSFHGNGDWDSTLAKVGALSLSPMKNDPRLGQYVELLINNEAYCIMLEQRPVDEYYKAISAAKDQNLNIKITRYRSTGDTCIHFMAMTAIEIRKEALQAELDSLNALDQKKHD